MAFEDPFAAFRIQQQPEQDAASAPTFQDPYAAFRVKNNNANSGGRSLSSLITGEKPEPGMIEDVAKSIPTGVAKGAIGLAATPGFAAKILSVPMDWAAQVPGRLYNRYFPGGDGSWDMPEFTLRSAENARANAIGRPIQDVTSSDIQRQVEKVTGDFYEPQTMAGRAAETISEFLPGGAIGKVANIPRNLAVWGVAPGAAAAVVDEAARGTWAAPFAKPAAGVLTGGALALALRPSRAGAMVTEHAQGMTAGQLDDMERLMQQSQQMGIPLTRAEAAQQVTGGATRLGDLQHLVEGHGGLKPFMAERPQQINTAGRAAMDQIAPIPDNPAMIGPQVGQAAQAVARDARAARTAGVDPYYKAAATDTVPADRVNAVIAQLDQIIAGDATGQLSGPARQMRSQLVETAGSPAIPAARTPVTDPNTGRVIRYEQTPAVAATPDIPVTNVGKLDDIYGSARDQFMGKPPLDGTQARANRLASQAVNSLDTELQAASPMLRQGRQEFQAISRRDIDPLMAGPIGRLAKKDPTTQKAIETLFPTNPIPNSEREVQSAMQALTAKNPWAARQLVRAHAEQVFNRATRDLASGPSQTGGANFVSQLRGDFQQDANMLAALSALPNGKQVIDGFDKLLEVLAATGKRQPVGSRTTFLREGQQGMQQGGAFAETAKAIASGGLKIPTMVKQRLDSWSLGRNSEGIAQLLTDPDAASTFRALAEAPMGSAKAAAAMSRLVYIGERGQKKE